MASQLRGELAAACTARDAAERRAEGAEAAKEVLVGNVSAVFRTAVAELGRQERRANDALARCRRGEDVRPTHLYTPQDQEGGGMQARTTARARQGAGTEMRSAGRVSSGGAGTATASGSATATATATATASGSGSAAAAGTAGATGARGGGTRSQAAMSTTSAGDEAG